jgi:hypothetical protein
MLKVAAWTPIKTEIVTLSDSITKFNNLYKILLESSTLIDSVRKNIGRTILNTISLVDTEPRVFSIRRIMSDSILLGNMLLLDSDRIRSMTEQITLVDTKTLYRGRIYRTYLESITETDRVIKALSRNSYETIVLQSNETLKTTKLNIETAILRDNIMRGTSRSIVNSISLIDTISSVSTLYETLSDYITLIDNNIIGTSRTITEMVILLDTKTTISNLIETLNEVSLLSDSTTFELGKSLSEIIAGTDLLLKRLTIFRTLSDDVILSDTETGIFAVKRSLFDSLSLTDSMLKMAMPFLLEIITLDDIVESSAIFKIIESITVLGLLNRRIIMDLMNNKAELSEMHNDIKLDITKKKETIGILKNRIIIDKKQ